MGGTLGTGAEILSRRPSAERACELSDDIVAEVVVIVEPIDGCIRISVDDDGPGVPEHNREVIFERFSRLDQARGRREGCAGLGLALVASIVEHHGGKIDVYRSDLGGARFTVELPIAAPSDPAAYPEEPSRKSVGQRFGGLVDRVVVEAVQHGRSSEAYVFPGGGRR
ncbi:MAG: ATP-binding protein [Acidimicrobiia bacterium]|nr:ATP-binding protein [Acidimicrobiia bacterium]